jgi:hypothetical protein
MAAAITRFEHEDVGQRLDALGLQEEQLLHTARRWHLTWSSFTPNHPPVGIGISAWTEAVAALREQFLPVGWSRSDERNYSLVVHPDGTHAINVASEGRNFSSDSRPRQVTPRSTAFHSRRMVSTRRARDEVHRASARFSAWF